MRRLPDARRLPAWPSAAVTGLGVVVLAAVLTACSSGSSSPAAASTTAKPVVTTTAPPALEAAEQIPDCDTLLPVTAVHDALGQTTLGPTYTRDVAHPSIHRTGSVSCAYTLTGVPVASSGPTVAPLPVISPAAPTVAPPGAPPPATPTPSGPPQAVTGTLATYDDAASAAARIQATVDSARQHGDTVTPTTVAGASGWVLTDQQSTTLIVADRNRTITIDVFPLAAPTQNASAVAITLATTMIAAPFGTTSGPSNSAT